MSSLVTLEYRDKIGVMSTCTPRFSTSTLTPGVAHRWLSFAGFGLVAVVVCLLVALAFTVTSVENQSSLAGCVESSSSYQSETPSSTGVSGLDNESGWTVKSQSLPDGHPAENQVASRRTVELRWSIDSVSYRTSVGRRLILTPSTGCHPPMRSVAMSVGHPTLVSLRIRLQA
tara:strand:+ start:107692 stop:108210 length:519 start_codon:yes stop_codon:yes gene_type:complete